MITTVKVGITRCYLWLSRQDGQVLAEFAGDLYPRQLHADRNAYAYTHGGSLYQAAVDRAHELGLFEEVEK